MTQPQSSAAHPIFLKDYTPPAWLVDEVHLTFVLDPKQTRVKARIAFRPNPDRKNDDFFLHGEGLILHSSSINGRAVTPEITDKGLRCAVPEEPFVWESEVEIAPEANTALEGLYMSNGMYCTQCEAEGFRKITYYPDRPDVMAPFTVRIESALPVLLSNGDPVASGPGWAEWHDPWPKPSYLFALVAGDLIRQEGQFTTAEGRDVALNVWVRPEDEGKTDFALKSLIASMKWDEERYARHYDLSVFNIVAVSDFNMGAMENKGLNIFNSSAVLASPETATDDAFERIEAIIAHEYFHNWTGNRVTCRDWFQLCLKEGLTVYRDQQFTSDLRGAAVKRISDVAMLRARQFPEDAGPLAHPVRPDHFFEINNFYTATVYEKGAELIGMLRTLIGDDAYQAGCQLYFQRHDGQAVTIEDWLAAFESVTGRDLTQFAHWYHQAGTPRLTVKEAYDESTGALTLRLAQNTAPTPDGGEKLPLHMPIAVGLLAPDGSETHPTRVLELRETEESFVFEGLQDRPVISVLRGFSAPVVLDQARSDATLAFLLRHDTDPVTRWDAGRDLARGMLLGMAQDGADVLPLWTGALATSVTDSALDPAFRARLLALPPEAELARAAYEAGAPAEPQRLFEVRRAAQHALAEALGGALDTTLAETHVTAPYAPSPEQIGQRALHGALLWLKTLRDGPETARAAFTKADNLTERVAALSPLIATGAGAEELAVFYQSARADKLLTDRWFGLQAGLVAPENALETLGMLTNHADFTWKNPNRFRAVLGGFAANHAGFHAPGGGGYTLLADWLIRLDPVNPQIAARMSQAFQSWKLYDSERQAQMRAALERIAATPALSGDTREMVGRLLG